MQVTVLSPHRDDAAFSCGLLLTRLLSTGAQLSIVNVCTNSRYAPYHAQSEAGNTQQISAVRQREDAAFLQLLLHQANAESAAGTFTDLGWNDVPLRWHMPADAAQAAMDLLEREVETLELAFRALPATEIVLVPQSIGGHIDHRLVRAAAMRAFLPTRIVFYDDLPYACRRQNVETTHTTAGMWLPENGAGSGVKRAYANCYPSQIAPDVADELEAYAARHGYRERMSGHSQALAALQGALHTAEIHTAEIMA